MNWKNTLFWYENGLLYGEWLSRDRADPDYDGVPVIKLSVPAESVHDRAAMKRLRGKLSLEYDKWVKQRGG